MLLTASALITSVFAVGYLAIAADAVDYIFLASRVFRFALIVHFAATAGLAYWTHQSIEEARNRHEFQMEIMAQRLLIVEESNHLYDRQEQFIQNVSHEMRTPLAMLRAANELMLLQEFGAQSPDQERILRLMARRIESLIHMANQMIGIMRTGQYASHDDVTAVAMDVIVAEIVEDMVEFAAEHDLNLTLVEVESGICLAHPDLLHQALNNVLFNAVKFTEPAGAIGVSATVADGWYEICVSDTGIGIPEPEIGRVFERFYQVDGSSTRRYGGLGLGLAVVKYVTEFNRGQVLIESTEGSGTTVRLLFPLSE